MESLYTQINFPSQKKLVLITFGYLCLLLFFSIVSTFVVALAVSLLRLLFQKLNLLELQPSDNTLFFSAYFFNEPMLLLTAWLCFRFSIRKKHLLEKTSPTKLKVLSLGITGAVCVLGFLTLCGYLTTLVYGENLKDPIIERFLSFSPSYRIFFAILGSLLAPICEEIFFRRALFETFRQYNYVITGIIFSSLLFALAHFPTFIQMGFLYFIGYFIAGVILAVIYHKTNSILTSMLAHVLVNTSFFLFYFYSIT